MSLRKVARYCSAKCVSFPFMETFFSPNKTAASLRCGKGGRGSCLYVFKASVNKLTSWWEFGFRTPPPPAGDSEAIKAMVSARFLITVSLRSCQIEKIGPRCFSLCFHQQPGPCWLSCSPSCGCKFVSPARLFQWYGGTAFTDQFFFVFQNKVWNVASQCLQKSEHTRTKTSTFCWDNIRSKEGRRQTGSTFVPSTDAITKSMKWLLLPCSLGVKYLFLNNNIILLSWLRGLNWSWLFLYKGIVCFWLGVPGQVWRCVGVSSCVYLHYSHKRITSFILTNSWFVSSTHSL